jgi:phospholipid/cholesterol/gamma-HCH transport system permease protein
MNQPAAGFELDTDKASNTATLRLYGSWVDAASVPEFRDVRAQLTALTVDNLHFDCDELGDWTTLLMSFLLSCASYCEERGVAVDTEGLPENARRLLSIATSVPAHQRQQPAPQPWWHVRSPSEALRELLDDLRVSLAFFGDICIALGALIAGKANTRFADFRTFCYQSGPDAFAIISLTSVLVGMILGYLGAVQLQQFGAGIYVADLVTIGLLREMSPLMTAIVMAGRTGAAYAAQLGTMQASEEIDAVRTLGVSPIEFLVIPRILALVVTMPLLTIYANLLGIVGGGIVAGGMGISLLQYSSQAGAAVSIAHIGIGLLKSLVFAVLIAIAGCRSGMQSGRNSAGVGRAATEAVVTALVYLIVADASINILFQHLGI